MSYPRDWSNVRDNIANPDVFLDWIRANVHTNRLTKYFHCGETINNGQAVMVGTDGKAYLFNVNNPTHETKFAGVAETSGDPNIIIRVVTEGVIYVEDQPWIAGESYYVDTDSFLTSTLPVSGIIRLVGVGLEPGRLLIMPSGGSGSTPSEGDENIDGGTWNSVYLPSQLIDGGGF
jgi:hypothetical protein